MVMGAVAVFADTFNGEVGTQPEDIGLEPGDALIEILPEGFNPTFCAIPRHTTVYFFNNTNEEQQVLGVTNPNIDSPVLEPGERTSGVTFGFIGQQHVELASDESIRATIQTDSPFNCQPNPPTPTPTPTFTPSPTPTMTPTPIPTPEGRKGVFPGVAKDEEVAQ